MNKFFCGILIMSFLLTGTKGCDIPEMTPEDRDRIEREWKREQERERTLPPPENWKEHIK